MAGVAWCPCPSLTRDAQSGARHIVVDSCDLDTGEVRQVTARGSAEMVDFDPARARRMLIRNLGPDQTTWDERFRANYLSKPAADTRLVRLAPERLSSSDLSFSPGR